MKKIKNLFLFFVLVFCTHSYAMYFCTAANSDYFFHLINLIGSIHKTNFDNLSEITVFDLGLTENQKKYLTHIHKLRLLPVELTHPGLLTPYATRSWGKPVPGCYAWKPVIIKQALELYPLVVYIDAGTTVLQPLDNLFKYIQEKNYFFHNGSDWCLRKETTQYVIDHFKLNTLENRWLLDDNTFGLEAGLMGITRALWDDFIFPMYELTKNLDYFVDDGTVPGGFGNSRHDLTLFSIFALKNNYTIHHHFKDPHDPCWLETSRGTIPLYIACVPEGVTSFTSIYCSRHDLNSLSEYIKYIRVS